MTEPIWDWEVSMYVFQSYFTGTIYLINDLGETSYEKLIASATSAYHRDEFSLIDYTVALTLDEGTLYVKA